MSFFYCNKLKNISIFIDLYTKNKIRSIRKIGQYHVQNIIQETLTRFKNNILLKILHINFLTIRIL